MTTDPGEAETASRWSRPSPLRMVLAVVGLVVGSWFIYAFGAGYFGHLALPNPLNVFVSVALLVWLLLALRRYVRNEREGPPGGLHRH